MIHLEGVSVVYPSGVQALNDVSLHIGRGEFCFIVGSSGSGKSTLLQLIYREVSPTSGRVVFDGQDVAQLPAAKVPFLRRKIGIVFQDFRLLPDMTVWENVGFALDVLGATRREKHRKVPISLELVGLGEKAASFPHELSGGEQQRVCIARALVNGPPVLLCDEPTGNLDPDTSWDIVELLSHISETGTTVLMATHDKYIVDRLRKRVVNLVRGTLVRDDQTGTYDVS
ncbi:MAG: cell division ATP-binding protein FtsE [Armatimonadetes bacterium]|jgi:cell division transport system ATP-binding protein|nr:cell division ATP-binding protein FtsE [Armatimonadota bacterium]MDI9585835.1 cell division ATP-binding protein FtsE [Acidobacteriota bacterium]